MGVNPSFFKRLCIIQPAPGAIGGTTPAAITGTTITANTGFVGSLNGSVGASIPNTGAFTTLSASSTVSGTGFSNYLASPPAIGGTTAAAGTFTNLAYTGTLTGSTGVINIGSGQVYKDASGNVGIGTSSPTVQLDVQASDCQIKVASTGTGYATSVFRNSNNSLYVGVDNAAGSAYGVANAGIIYGSGAYPISFFTNASEKMRLTSAGYLGIGTSSPGAILDVRGTQITYRSDSSGTHGSQSVADSPDDYIMVSTSVKQDDLEDAINSFKNLTFEQRCDISNRTKQKHSKERWCESINKMFADSVSQFSSNSLGGLFND